MAAAILDYELQNQTCQEFDLDGFCRMVSPRQVISPDENRLREHFTYTIEDPRFQEAFDADCVNLEQEFPSRSGLTMGETGRDDDKHYTEVLNTVFSAGRSMLDNKGIFGSYHDGNAFFTYNRETGDGALGSTTSMILSLPQEFKNQEDATAWWSAQDEQGFMIDLVAKVENDWWNVVCQTAKCARYLFAASPTRLFALLIGINREEDAARFLIFHQSGVTSCRSLSLGDPVGRAGFLRIAMTILLWGEVFHAGYDPSCDHVNYKIPEGRSTALTDWATELVLYRYVCIHGRATRVHLLRRGFGHASPSTRPYIEIVERHNEEGNNDSQSRSGILPAQLDIDLKCTKPQVYKQVRSYKGDKLVLKDFMQEPSLIKLETEIFSNLYGQFGIPNMCRFWCPVYENLEAQFTAIFLPSANTTKEHFWDILEKGEEDSRPPIPEVRDRICMAYTSEGVDLATLKSVWGIFESITHAMLGSLIWSLHSIRPNPFTNWFTGWLTMYQSGYLLFKIISMFRVKHPTSADDSINTIQTEVHETAKKLKKLVNDLGISTECSAVITGGDLAVSWKDLFEQWTENELKGGKTFGTTCFMSTCLRQSIEYREYYLQSPLDDIESFFWVGLSS
ncbi:hypothetical protein AX17_002634 [Amanita inopinata Kibby_2008]|nr:hypothetical protein AX17_002634 [Amanita inopinata Kibby_2008]